MNHSFLPQILKEIADVAGLEAAIEIARVRGGMEVYIPAKADCNHWLVRSVGEEAAKLICDHFTMNGGGMRINIPFGPVHRNAVLRRRVDKMIKEGKSAGEIVRATGYTERGVFYRRAALKQSGEAQQDQISMFE